MMLCFCFAVSCMGKFCRRKFSKNGLFAIDSYSRNPSFVGFAPRRSNESRCIGFFWFARKILQVLRLICFTQIIKPIVAWVAINMVNVFFRPAVIKIKPYQAMGVKTTFRNANCNSAVDSFNASNRTNFCFATMTNGFKPSKQTSIGVVMQILTHKFWGNIGCSHDAPCKRIGQRLGSVSALVGLRYFNITSSGTVTF